MIDINLLRKNPDFYKKATAAKQVDPKVVDVVLELDDKRRELIAKVEGLRKRRNELAHSQGKSRGKPSSAKASKGREIKDLLKKLEPELKLIEIEYKKALFDIPNPPAKDVKTGKSDKENEVLRKEGKIKKFDFKPKDYLTLAESLDIIDVARASKVSGSRFGYLKADAARLELALVQFAMETLAKEGFVPVIPPVLIKKEMMGGMGYLEHGGEEDMYVFDKDGLVLVGTSEQSVGPMHSGEILPVKDLPRRYMGFSSCFRREAGSYGKDTKGIIRVHQFDKVEMFSFCEPEKSDKEHEFLLSLEEKLFGLLEIPYQVVKMCSGDLGAPASRKYDLEAWMPGQGTYREVTSTSNTNDFQARRLNIKYAKEGKVDYLHMLNGTAFAIGRTIVAIIENYQLADGSIAIPKVLQKWMGKKINSGN
jgi:seryl-tRNA synthetase